MQTVWLECEEEKHCRVCSHCGQGVERRRDGGSVQTLWLGHREEQCRVCGRGIARRSNARCVVRVWRRGAMHDIF